MTTSSIGRFVALGLMAAALGRPATTQACTICGAGDIEYFAWQCIDGEWEAVLVGLGGYPECGAVPRLIFGVETDCFGIERDVGGGTEDEGQCSSFECPPPPRTGCEPDPRDPPDPREYGEIPTEALPGGWTWTPTTWNPAYFFRP